jgi:hypothetical protein
MTHLSEKRHSFDTIESQPWHSDGEEEVTGFEGTSRAQGMSFIESI